LNQAGLEREPSTNKSTMETDAPPEGATVEPAAHGQGDPKQEQTDQQSQHRPEAEIEAGMDEAEHSRLQEQTGSC